MCWNQSQNPSVDNGVAEFGKRFHIKQYTRPVGSEHTNDKNNKYIH